MDITFGDWSLRPYKSNGQRCWQLGKKGRAAMWYPSTIGAAIEKAANYTIRNNEDCETDLAGALERYREILTEFREAAKADFGDGKVGR